VEYIIGESNIANVNMKLVLGSLAVAGGFLFGATSVSADTHTVQSGDTLNALSAKHNVSVEKIALDNNIKDINLIYVGEQLDINPVTTQTKVPTTVVETPKAEVVIPHVEQQQPAQPAQPTQVPVATGGEEEAREWIGQHESGGSYTISNSTGSGAFGKYQLMPFNLKYGTSPEGQERAADEYMKSRYHTWQNAKAFWIANNWW